MLTTFFRTIKDDTSGATAIEYGLIVGLIVIGMMVSMQTFASATLDMWDYVESETVDALTP